MRSSFRLQTGVTLLRSHGYLRPHREREGSRFLRWVAIPVALSEFRDPLQNAVPGILLRLLIALLNGVSLQVFQSILQTL